MFVFISYDITFSDRFFCKAEALYHSSYDGFDILLVPFDIRSVLFDILLVRRDDVETHPFGHSLCATPEGLPTLSGQALPGGDWLSDLHQLTNELAIVRIEKYRIIVQLQPPFIPEILIDSKPGLLLINNTFNPCSALD